MQFTIVVNIAQIGGSGEAERVMMSVTTAEKGTFVNVCDMGREVSGLGV